MDVELKTMAFVEGFEVGFEAGLTLHSDPWEGHFPEFPASVNYFILTGKRMPPVLTLAEILDDVLKGQR